MLWSNVHVYLFVGGIQIVSKDDYRPNFYELNNIVIKMLTITNQNSKLKCDIPERPNVLDSPASKGKKTYCKLTL